MRRVSDTVATILVTDDDPGIRDSFTDYLEDHEYRVLTAQDGQAGLEAFQRDRPDLVLLDLRMPRLGGLDLLREIKSLDPDVPLVVVSGTGRIADAVEALRLGAWDYLLKPVEDLSVLGHTVRRSLERAQLRRDNRAYQQELERLVRERTAELEETNQRLHHLNERLRKIVASTSTLSSWLDMREFGSNLLNEFAHNMNATGGSLYLVEESALRLLHAIDPGHAPGEIPLPLDETSVFRRVIEDRTPVLIANLRELDDVKGSGWEGYANASALVLPIPDENGRVAAVLSLHNKTYPPFVEQDKEIGMILASYSCESLRTIRTFEALSDSERRFRELADMLPQTICETDRHGTIAYANQQAFSTFGYTADDLKSGLTIFDLISPEEIGRASKNAEEVTRNGLLRITGTEYKAIRKDGTEFPVLVYSAPILQGETPKGMRVVAVDITLRKQQEELITRQAHFDNLTDLPNRFLSLDRLDQLLREAKRTDKLLAVLFLDLDDFKKINDSLGHEVGDELLIQVAARLRESLRNADTIGRLGGDEFIVLLGGLTAPADARLVVDNLLKNLRQPYLLKNRELVLTASLGIAVYPGDGDTPAELLRSADTAMYHAKSEGRNTYHYFTPEMNEDVSRRLMLEQHLHGALARGELRLCYQPVVDLASRTVVGFEALLRWHNALLGETSPTEFIPIAEQTGLIVSIGEFVLNEALGALAAWQRRYGRTFKMAVNMSPRQFRDPKLLERVAGVLKALDVPPESLELEITEGVLMVGHAYIENALATLRDLGVGIIMDDFGTGYSSLGYLRTYPFDGLKVDRSFVGDIEDEKRGRKLVSAAIAMAHGLGLRVVAEGVETEAQLEFLMQQGCDLAQGYYFSRPIPAEEVDTLLGEMP